MSSNLDTLKSQYRSSLCGLSQRERLEIECALLYEMKQRVLQAQMQFDKLGGQARIDSIVFCLDEMDEFNG